MPEEDGVAILMGLTAHTPPTVPVMVDVAPTQRVGELIVITGAELTVTVAVTKQPEATV
jgi:hypothetical protein